MILLGASLWLAGSAAWALDGNDTVSLVLAGGTVVEGRFLRAEPGTVVISTQAQGPVAVPLVIVEGAAVNGAALGLEVFLAEAEEAWERRLAVVEAAPSAPSPAVVAGASMLWAGAGHATLGEWRTFAGYSAAEAVIWGAVALSIVQDDTQAVVPLIGLDLIFRAWSAQESARTARRRREILRAADAAGDGP